MATDTRVAFAPKEDRLSNERVWDAITAVDVNTLRAGASLSAMAMDQLQATQEFVHQTWLAQPPLRNNTIQHCSEVCRHTGPKALRTGPHAHLQEKGRLRLMDEILHHLRLHPLSL